MTVFEHISDHLEPIHNTVSGLGQLPGKDAASTPAQQQAWLAGSSALFLQNLQFWQLCS